MARGGADSPPLLTTIYWRDIPAQVVAKSGRRRARWQLSERFQLAIDRAATRAGKTRTDDYIAEWRDERRPCGDDLGAVVEAEAARLEEAFSDQTLEALVRNRGWSP